MKFKNGLVQFLGIITTLISIALIYLILFKDGKLRGISMSVIVEFVTVVIITVTTKFFWYTSTESSIRTSEQYLEKRSIVSETIETNIVDAKDFDDFIDVENDSNYNRYISNRCKNMTVQNYKLSFFDRLHRIFYKKEKSWYMIRYMLKVEREAAKQHKLSGHNIRSLTQSGDGLTDDRNFANAKKLQFLWIGVVFSFCSMLFTSLIGFQDKTNIDMRYAILKMVMYVSQILFSILQAILKARMTVINEDMSYFNKIISIVEKYVAYKSEPYVVERISYIPKEVTDGINSESDEAERHVNTDG